MDRTRRTRPRSAGLVITPGALVLLFGAIIGAILLRNLFIAGRRPIGWAVAAVVLAAAIEPMVSYFSRYMRRGVALLCVLLPLFAGVGFVAQAVYRDLDTSIESLQKALPEAAQRLEDSERFGRAAKQIDLKTRAEEISAKLKKPSANLAGQAQSSAGAFLVTTILTVFALGWGPRFASGALDQIGDKHRRERTARIAGRAFTRSQVYVDAVLAQGVVTGVAAWVLFRLLDVPAPTPLALLVAVMSTVPVLGIIAGVLPAVMLSAGFDSFNRAGIILIVALAAQIAQIILIRRLTARTLYVGPAVMVIAFLIGFDIYSLGGAVFGTAIAVFGVALADSWAEENHTIDLPPSLASPIEDHPQPAG